MYKVLVDFKDLRDSGYEYHAGDTYPREGLEVSEERFAMLSAPTEQRGALIIATKGEADAAVESAPAVEEVAPVIKAETEVEAPVAVEGEEEEKSKAKSKKNK